MLTKCFAASLIASLFPPILPDVSISRTTSLGITFPVYGIPVSETVTPNSFVAIMLLTEALTDPDTIGDEADAVRGIITTARHMPIRTEQTFFNLLAITIVSFLFI